MSFKISSLLHVVVMPCASVEILTRIYSSQSLVSIFNITQGYNNYQRKGRNITFQLIICMLSTVIRSHGANVIEPRRTVPCSTVAITMPARYGTVRSCTCSHSNFNRAVPYHAEHGFMCRVNTVLDRDDLWSVWH